MEESGGAGARVKTLLAPRSGSSARTQHALCLLLLKRLPGCARWTDLRVETSAIRLITSSREQPDSGRGHSDSAPGFAEPHS